MGVRSVSAQRTDAGGLFRSRRGRTSGTGLRSRVSRADDTTTTGEYSPPTRPVSHAASGRREIAAPNRIVVVNSFSDETGGITRHPMSPTWPREMLSTFTLDEQGGQTTVAIEWIPLNPTEEERKTFDGAHDGMKQGWTGTFDQLAEYLARS